MSSNQTNPLRVARIRAKKSQAALAREVGVSRPMIVALEDGRTKNAEEATLGKLDAALGQPAGTLQLALAKWQARRAQEGVQFTPHQRAILELTPKQLHDEFDTFVAWRKMFAPSATAFAIMLGMQHPVVTGYEQGIRVRGMPEVMQAGLLEVFGVTPEYLSVLMELEPDRVA